MNGLIALITPLADDHGWHHGGWWILWLVVWAALIALVVVLVLRTRSGGPPAAGADPAATILAERYARGEITDQEYRERLKTLRES
jgi:putative membrane protein